MWELMQADRRARNAAHPSRPRLLTLPDGAIDGPTAQELCAVCARAAVDAHDRWTWLACPACLLVDAAAARLLRTERLLPLGRHPSMNAGCLDWDGLHAWRSAESLRVAVDAGLPSSGQVDWTSWPSAGSDPVLTSASAFTRLVAQCLPELAATHEVLTDAAGLAARARQTGTG